MSLRRQTEFAPCVFVGGTGRSGTTIAAELIGWSSRYELMPTEVRFHADAGGLADLLDGDTEPADFASRMRNEWYYRRPNARGVMRGLHVFTTGRDFEDTLRRFEQQYPTDPHAAARALVHELLDPVARRAGKPGWVEATPPSARVAGAIGGALPHARFVHMVRDGRDVASSVAKRGWGPDDILEAVRWWGAELAAIFQSQARLPLEQVLTLRIESLVGPDRWDAYWRLLAFVEVDDEPDIRRFFEDQVTAGRAHQERWRHNLDVARIREVEEVYEETLDKLAAQGFSLPDV